MMARATRAPLSAAAGLGILYGSSAWMLRPVGSTPGPSRRRSPPVAGGTYSPPNARMTPVSSSVFFLSKSRISTASARGSSFASSAASFSNERSSDALTSSNDAPAGIDATARTSSSESLSPKYASRYWPAASGVGSAPMVWSPSLKSLFSSTPRYAYRSEAYFSNAAAETSVSPFSIVSEVIRIFCPETSSMNGQSASRPAEAMRSNIGPRSASKLVSLSSRYSVSSPLSSAVCR
mmetsp:Transcript_9530/g.37122  ORF Transcript_9530/g.37122 Transcript_9530/m.37122 type:complete len:236 (+) Transcript_9530:1189-1896(+)